MFYHPRLKTTHHISSKNFRCDHCFGTIRKGEYYSRHNAYLKERGNFTTAMFLHHFHCSVFYKMIREHAGSEISIDQGAFKYFLDGKFPFSERGTPERLLYAFIFKQIKKESRARALQLMKS